MMIHLLAKRMEIYFLKHISEPFTTRIRKFNHGVIIENFFDAINVYLAKSMFTESIPPSIIRASNGKIERLCDELINYWQEKRAETFARSL